MEGRPSSSSFTCRLLDLEPLPIRGEEFEAIGLESSLERLHVDIPVHPFLDPAPGRRRHPLCGLLQL